MKNAIHHFELPVRDMERAVACYEALLGTRLRRELLAGCPTRCSRTMIPGSAEH